MANCMFLLFLFFSMGLLAAPFPVSSTSSLTDSSEGNFFASHGFRFTTSKLNWHIVPDGNISIFETFQYIPKGNSSAKLTIRKDEIGKHKNIEDYAKKWMKEYPQYGFEVLATKNMTLGGGEALLIDFIHRNKRQQIRQLVLHKNKKVVIMTCIDSMTSFNVTVSDCNQMMTSFSWR
ncbi:MAG: hypothetical protein HUU56_01970 [Bdellovibrionaceae bacterium]|nr:hypothetical protein [Pseudobdellovibrionaceae bacterium]